MNKVRVGLIGTATWAREAHIKNLLQMGEAEIVALWNRGKENLQSAKEMLPASVRVCSSIDMMLEDRAIDAVIISLPPNLNEDYVIPALKRGKHVFCEKPLSNTLAGCRRIVDAAESSGRVLQVGFELRYSEFYQEVRALLDLNKVGQLHMIAFKSFSGVGWAYREGTWIIDPQASGGVMNSWGVHAIDLMNGLAGSEPTHVYGVGDVKVRKQTPNVDSAYVTIEYANGVLAALLYCRFSPYGNDWELSLVGDQGNVAAFLNRREIHHHTAVNETETVVKLAPYKGSGFTGALEQMRTFVRCCQQGQRPPTDGLAGLCATQTALAIQRSFDERRRVSLDEIQ